MMQVVGAVIPFLPNDEYYVEEYSFDYDDGTTEIGVNFYTYGNTKSEFSAYRALFSGYTYVGTEKDEYGDSWYYYDAKDGSYCIDMSYYETEEGYVADIYVYYLVETGTSGGGSDSGNSGSGSDSGGSGNTNENLITNQGAGLPSDADGVFDVDFTDAEYVKNVTDQGYYVGGCPTTGSPAVLVIPVQFSNATASSKGYEIDDLVNAFGKNGKTDYYSVYDYYYISSYGQLTLDITVLDFWFTPQYDSDYYYNAKYDYYGSEVEIGDQLIMDEALAYLARIMDLSDFDSDNNGIIDSIVLINTLDIGDENFYWAYRYWNIYTDDDGSYYEYDGVSANDYVWASYQFLKEGYDEGGNATYDDPSVMNTYTYIHEFAHVLGVDDYYDTAYVGSPLDGADIMDSMLGDHNAFTKFNLGWLTTSRLVVTDSSVTLRLDAFGSTGDTIIIANNWDESLGAYQEYYILVYYTNTGLNYDESGSAGYFARNGIVVYHVNASLYTEEYDGELYYDVYNNNTDKSDDYGTADNLIEYVKSAAGTLTYVEGDTLPSVIDDQGNALGHTFVVDALNADYATITFTKA
jgi:M6 family metalloprotease-like protein